MASRRRRGKKTSKKEEEKDNDERVAALATIERLSNKYLTKSPNISGQQYGIIRGDSFLQSDSSIEEGTCKESKNSRREEIKENDSSMIETKINRVRRGRTTAKTTTPLSHKTHKTRLRQRMNASISSNNTSDSSSSSAVQTTLSEDGFRVPRPVLGESTPAPLHKPKRESLYGFGDLDSPLTLSPVTSTDISPYRDNSVRETSLPPPPQPVPPAGPSTKKPTGMYDLVPAARPCPAKRNKSKKKLDQQRTAEMAKWAAEMNAMFADIEKDELHVVVEKS